MSSILETIQRTFLIERVTSLLVYVLLLITVFLFLKKANSYLEVKRCLNIYLLLLVVMALFFVPDESKDLTRILRNTEYWKDITFRQLVDLELSKTSTPVGSIFIYLCRQTRLDGFLPACTALIFYWNVFYIIKKCYEKLNCSSDSIATALFMFMSSGCFLEVISDVRCFLAYSIVARFVFDEICLNKSILRSIVFYLLAIYIHLSVFPIIVIRLLAYIILESRRKSITRFLSVLSVVVASIVIAITSKGLIAEVFAKAKSYLYVTHYSYLWEYIIGAMFWIVILYIVVICKKNIRGITTDSSLIFLSNLSLMLLIVEFAFNFEYNIFHRYILMSLLIAIPLLSIFLSRPLEKPLHFKKNIIIFSTIILALVCMRGNLCGYKFFVLEW